MQRAVESGSNPDLARGIAEIKIVSPDCHDRQLPIVTDEFGAKREGLLFRFI